MFRRFKFFFLCRRYRVCRRFCPVCRHFDVCFEVYLAEVDSLPWIMPFV